MLHTQVYNTQINSQMCSSQHYVNLVSFPFCIDKTGEKG